MDTEDGPQLQLTETKVSYDSIDELYQQQFISIFENQMEELMFIEDDSGTLKNLIANYTACTVNKNFRLFALTVAGNNEKMIEYSFSQFHPRTTVINGLNQLKRGYGCKSWRQIFVHKVPLL